MSGTEDFSLPSYMYEMTVKAISYNFHYENFRGSPDPGLEIEIVFDKLKKMPRFTCLEIKGIWTLYHTVYYISDTPMEEIWDLFRELKVDTAGPKISWVSREDGIRVEETIFYLTEKKE